MTNGTRNPKVTTDLRPAYYDEFRCLAQNCRLTCCNGWRIDFDKNDYLKMKKCGRMPALSDKMEGAFRRIRGEHPDGHYAGIKLQENGNCPLLSAEGLCTLQVEAGFGVLPGVCKIFPRMERKSDYLERSLSLGCEAVLHQLWDLPEGIDFRSDPLPEKEQFPYPAKENLQPYIRYFQDIRSVCIDILQARSISLPQRILFLGMRLQELMQDESATQEWIQKTAMILAAPEMLHGMFEGYASTDQMRTMYIINNIKVFFLPESNQNILQMVETFKAYLDLTNLGNGEAKINVERYAKAEAQFQKAFGDKEYFFENLMVSLFFQMQMPAPHSAEAMWESYVQFCHLYGYYRFLAALSTEMQLPPLVEKPDETSPAPGTKDALFRVLVLASRELTHSRARAEKVRKDFYDNESTTLAHMAILLGL